MEDIFFGVPVKLGAGGIENILEIELNTQEKLLIEQSAESIRENIRFLYSKNIL
jgi:malate dehydrogenase